MTPLTPPAWLPYSAATVFQRTQALQAARRILDAAYPFLSGAQWQHALAHLQLPLQQAGDQVSFSSEALATLVQHLEAQYRAAPPDLTGPPPPRPAPRRIREKSRKQTYAVPLSQIEQLARVSYWCRWPTSQLVTEAFAQLLSQYPEAQRPLPEQQGSG
ncbi:MAG: hypothetical protein ACRYFX_18055 [Janthinobacterium lividum]